MIGSNTFTGITFTITQVTLCEHKQPKFYISSALRKFRPVNYDSLEWSNGKILHIQWRFIQNSLIRHINAIRHAITAIVLLIWPCIRKKLIPEEIFSLLIHFRNQFFDFFLKKINWRNWFLFLFLWCNLQNLSTKHLTSRNVHILVDCEYMA